MKRLLGNESGVALIMVMTSILILVAMWGDFTFESKVSRIKATNMLDKSQSRMMAESGLEFAMLRLRLYKEAYNARAGNQTIASSVPVQLLNQLWEQPFIYPIPVGKDANASVRDAIATFEKESLLEGEMKISIQNISNKLNLNMIRLSQLDRINRQQTAGPDRDGDGVTDDQDPEPDNENVPNQQPAKDPDFSMEQQLLRHLQLKIREKGEEDEDFRDRYGNTDPAQLVANLKFYISDRNPRRANNSQIDVMLDNSEQLFSEAKITPKHGPLSSFSEIYLIPGWDDAIVALISGEFDVFPAVMIDLNKLTANMLKMLIPNINEDEIRDFFKWRDNPEKPQFFNSVDDFKAYIVTQANILSETAFNDLFAKYQAQGIQFGVSPTLFRVLSEGTSNNTSTTLVATVSIPTAPTAPGAGQTAGSQGGAQGGTQGGATATQGGSQGGSTANTNGGSSGGGGTTGQNTQTLLDPRIIDLQFN